ncbi:MAG: hypothetical protein MUD08_02885 [Cytophagales bacterium]|nr:hypothetical protein [Cytophagales bacterium]
MCQFVFAQANERTVPAKSAKPVKDRVSFFAELNPVSLIPITGDGALNAGVGVFFPKQRLSISVGGNTPVQLNDLSARTLFSNGENLNVYWNGEVNMIVRYHFARENRFSGLVALAGLGYEGFQISRLNNPINTNVNNNWFAGVGLGYTVFLFGGKVYLTPGLRTVFLLDNSGQRTIDGVNYDYNWGFFLPDIRIGVKF